MKILVKPHKRRFDGKTVYIWQIVDLDRKAVVESGCELSLPMAEAVAARTLRNKVAGFPW